MHDECFFLNASIPITDMLIHRITLLPHLGLNLAKAFGGKTSEHELVEKMKDKFKLVKKSRGYSITSINDPTVEVAMQILVAKVMRKCRTDKVSAPVVLLVAQCTEGLQFNWACYQCSEFLTNCREAQDESKSFHYSWLLLLIMLVTWDLLEDNQFPLVEKDFPEATKFVSLWATKEATRFIESKVFWVLIEARIHTDINQKP